VVVSRIWNLALECDCNMYIKEQGIWYIPSPPGGESLQSADRPVPRALHSETERPQLQIGYLVMSGD
jgi:hypothetical protein